jgi:hypothetical protein
VFKFPRPHCWQCSGQAVGRSIPKRPMYFVFCRLYPSSPHPSRLYLAPSCHLLLFANIAYLYDWRGFVGAKKKTSVGLSVFYSSMVYIHHVHCTSGKKGYTLHLYVHTTGGGRDTMEEIHRQYCWWWKGYTMHFSTTGG